MKRRSHFYLLILFLFVVTIFLFYPTDKKRIKKVINSCEEAITQKDINKLMKYISYNYTDDYGGSYLHLKERMQTIFKNLDDIDIEKDILKISVEKTLAETELKVRVIASEEERRGYIVGDAINAQKIKIYFEKSPYKWEVIKVDGVFNISGKRW